MGRRGREWVSPKGNCYASLILRPDVPIAEAAQLGFVAGNAIYDTIGEVLEPGYQCQLKWPNDVLLNERKVAGLLLESRAAGAGVPDYVILGFGVNLLHFPDDAEYPATSFREEGQIVSDAAFLEAFARHFMEWVTRWLNDGFAPVLENWRWRAKGIGEAIEVRLDNKTLSGVFEDLDAQGNLVLKTDTGVEKIAAGAVFFSQSGEGVAPCCWPLTAGIPTPYLPCSMTTVRSSVNGARRPKPAKQPTNMQCGCAN